MGVSTLLKQATISRKFLQFGQKSRALLYLFEDHKKYVMGYLIMQYIH